MLFTALTPRIGSVFIDTRDAFVVAVRARTLRELFAVVRFVVRATTLREPFVVRDETPRLTTLRDDVFARFDETVRAFVRGFATGAAPTGAFTGTAWNTVATGSANTARIDKNVEQTKNAATNKNTVPTAFLQKFPNERFFINTLLHILKTTKTTTFAAHPQMDCAMIQFYYNILPHACKQENHIKKYLPRR